MHCLQKADLGFIMLDQCSDLTLQGPATLDMATAALPITQVRLLVSHACTASCLVLQL